MFWPTKEAMAGGNAAQNSGALKVRPETLRRVCLAGLAMFVVFFFARRVPPHTRQFFFCDFANFYSGSRVWLNGGDPYQINQVYSAWHSSGHGRWLSIPNLEAADVWAGVYPPTVLAALAPFAAMSAVPAHIVWIGLNIAAFCAACAALWSIGRIRGWEQRLLVALLVFASSAGISTLDSGQLAFFACSLLIVGIWALRNHRPLLAGVLIGLAACYKIQVGIPVIFFLFLTRQWRSMTVSLVLFAVVTCIGILPMQLHHIDWFQQFTANATHTLDPKAVNDPRPGADFRNDMVNLQTILFAATSSVPLIEAITTAFVGAALALLAVMIWSAPQPQRSLPLFSAVIVLSVLPVYHRLYDTMALSLLLVWAIRYWRTPLHGAAVVTLVLLSEFLIPIDFVPTIARWAHIPSRITSSSWWQGLIVPHHAWGMLFLSVWLMVLCGTVYFRKGIGHRLMVIDPSSAPGHAGEIRAWAKLSHQRPQHG